MQLLLLAKAPVPGRVKTRLCPPWTYEQAAVVAAAALADTIDALTATAAVARTLVVDDELGAPPPGWCLTGQRGGPLDERIAAAYRDTALPGVASLLVGMDTPQLTPAHLGHAAERLGGADAVLGPAADGGWWLLGLRDPCAGTAVAGVPMSTARTAADTVAALRGHGLSVAMTATLRDVDTVADAVAVAAASPHGRFARTVAGLAAGAAR
ncbi:DUF2064 domain-containing protein [Dactylosporangium sp. AC04546]|uniref:TIGR04282 family arsenosugar biosynthesis glycosyltransferase n=1 Tax=Dactylosporangium sp. AC04546 TaxID=2862460 RepID=UPI001EDD6692|nr:DUF2064 domain-containing protein [Dactylosporangium sp. AC04546]WVK80808.1 DUF2064 domain-containing protein [Dactylosporangium sp. AC04546]